ncbi:hypothetical protein GcM1_225074b [Golovinomyces cichoracearum]|uniref:Uncharacterized protein n=1 Tax=Golovinomyces cichoracearum TaxID=62708 RepID=A0A420IQD0_9PEZI|nr:hypothetical protein GcM1_225074b [Golovinomyces cichoracearum]
MILNSEINETETSLMLQNQATMYALTSKNSSNIKTANEKYYFDSSVPEIFASEGSSRYSPNSPFYSIILDTSASFYSTAGKSQYDALRDQ